MSGQDTDAALARQWLDRVDAERAPDAPDRFTVMLRCRMTTEQRAALAAEYGIPLAEVGARIREMFTNDLRELTTCQAGLGRPADFMTISVIGPGDE
jgi:hypothetical protein